MRKKTVAVALIVGILLAFTGSAFSGWGPKTNKFGPIVTDPKAHPWGDSGHRANTPPCYRPGPGAGYQDLIIVPVFTNFTVQFYLKYVVKGKKDGQSSIRYHGKSE